MIELVITLGAVVLLEGLAVWFLVQDRKRLSREVEVAGRQAAGMERKVRRLERLITEIGEIERKRRERNEEIDDAGGNRIAELLSNGPGKPGGVPADS